MSDYIVPCDISCCTTPYDKYFGVVKFTMCENCASKGLGKFYTKNGLMRSIGAHHKCLNCDEDAAQYGLSRFCKIHYNMVKTNLNA